MTPSPFDNIFGKHFHYLAKILGKVGQYMTMSSRRPWENHLVFENLLQYFLSCLVLKLFLPETARVYNPVKITMTAFL